MSKMWPFILLLAAVAASASGTTVKVLHNGPQFNSSCIVLVVGCGAIGNSTSWSVNGETISVNSSELETVIFKMQKNSTLYVTLVQSQENQGKYQLTSLLYYIYDENSEPPEVTCSNSSGHRVAVDSRTRATSSLVDASSLIFFQYLFSTRPELGGENLIFFPPDLNWVVKT